MRSVCMCSSLRRWQPRTSALRAGVGAGGGARAAVDPQEPPEAAHAFQGCGCWRACAGCYWRAVAFYHGQPSTAFPTRMATRFGQQFIAWRNSCRCPACARPRPRAGRPACRRVDARTSKCPRPRAARCRSRSCRWRAPIPPPPRSPRGTHLSGRCHFHC